MCHASRLPAYASFVVIAVIGLACLNMVFVLRDGLPVGNSLVERAAFMNEQLLAWQLGWFNWMLSALGLLLFCSFLTRYIPPSTWRQFALLVVAIGIGPDLSAEAIYAFVLPNIPATTPGFEALDRLAMQLTGTIGNGAYNIGGLILNLLLLSNTRIPRWLILVGVPAWILGLALSVASALNWLTAAVFFTASAMAWSLCWMLLISATLYSQPQRYQYSTECN